MAIKMERLGLRGRRMTHTRLCVTTALWLTANRWRFNVISFQPENHLQTAIKWNHFAQVADHQITAAHHFSVAGFVTMRCPQMMCPSLNDVIIEPKLISFTYDGFTWLSNAHMIANASKHIERNDFEYDS